MISPSNLSFHLSQQVVLVVNCGSSSIKYQLLEMPQEIGIAGGILERIGDRTAVLKHTAGRNNTDEIREVKASTHHEAFFHIQLALKHSLETESHTDARKSALFAIGHRVVHGGELFSQPVHITPKIIEAIHRFDTFAPLHNPPNLIGIRACAEHFADVPQVAVFDTAFHHTMPPYAYRYALPEEWYECEGIRRYGFHGTSHRYVAFEAASCLGRPLATLRLITLHLGNGASVAAIDRGRCIDTSMGFTPLEGLVMGTRCGDMDPAVVLQMQILRNLTPQQVDHILNRESGLKGLCGVNDMREVLARANDGDEKASLALEVYCYRIKQYIGAYFVALGGLDALVFTGGVGENSCEIRERVCDGLECLGIQCDKISNQSMVHRILDVTEGSADRKVLVIRTNEELQIARETVRTLQSVS